MAKPHAYQHSKHPTQSDVDYHIKIQQKDQSVLPGSTIFDCLSLLSVWESAEIIPKTNTNSFEWISTGPPTVGGGHTSFWSFSQCILCAMPPS